MNSALQVEDTLDKGLSQLSQHPEAEFPERVREQLLQFVSLLIKWNRVYNLTAIRDPQTIVQRHLLDSLVLLRWLPGHSRVSTGITDVVDIGSGAGLPVLPLAMARPDLEFVSIEPNGKKSRFQQQVLLELGLDNVIVQGLRVEQVSLQAGFVTSRAFTAPLEFLQIAVPLCAKEAQVAVMLAHASRLPEPLPTGFSLQELTPVDIPGSSAPRHIAVCRYCA